LPPRQQKRLGELLDTGPLVVGCETACWHVGLLQMLSWREFGVLYANRPRACHVLDRRHMICIAMRAAWGYYIVLYRATRLIRREDGRVPTSGFDSTRPPGKGS
jgi:hypothetical protein